MKRSKLLLLAASSALLLVNCRKDKETTPEPRKPTPYSVRMTDASATYSAVNVDIQGVEITSNGTNVTLNVNAGVYNLLNYANGLDTLVATGSLTVDKVQQIRLVLGPNNSIVTTSGTTYSLVTPSAQQSGLKLQVHQDLQAGVAYRVLLDFDANQSVVNEGNGNYSLKPVIRTVETALSGAIKGRVSQAGVATTVAAGSNSGNYSTVVNANGDFIISGLPAGTYSVTVTPVAPYTSSTLNAVGVTTGITTTLGVISI